MVRQVAQDRAGVTYALADAVHRLRFEDLPPAVVTVAQGNLLDCTGVALAGVSQPVAAVSRRYALSLGTGEAVIWGRPERASLPAAALANGSAAHALDFDDCNQSMTGHPSAPIWPAVFALAAAKGCSGKDALTAYVAGLEVACKIGRSINPLHQQAGWHPTATLGTLGAAAACAKLMRLDVTQIAMTLGIAASLTGGLRYNFGTMTKPLHSGMAAFHGLTAALLGADRLTAQTDALSGELGFAGVFCAGQAAEEWDQVASQWGKTWEILDPGMDIKPYPCCRATHASIDCVLHLMKTHGIQPDQITSIRTGVSYMRPKLVVYDRPTTELQAKFSMQFCLATAAAYSGVGLEHFTPAGLADQNILAILPKVSMFVHPDMGPKPGVNPALELVGAEVTLDVIGGQSFSHRVQHGKGHSSVPMTDAELADKFHRCAAMLSEETRDQLADALFNLNRLDRLDSLCNLLADVRP